MLPKKSTVDNHSEFRPITLNDRLGLGFTQLIENKIVTHLKERKGIGDN